MDNQESPQDKMTASGVREWSIMKYVSLQVTKTLSSCMNYDSSRSKRWLLSAAVKQSPQKGGQCGWMSQHNFNESHRFRSDIIRMLF